MIPDYQDVVKHKVTEVVGRVIAVYRVEDELYFDVRSETERIYYMTPAKNWDTILKREEIE